MLGQFSLKAAPPALKGGLSPRDVLTGIATVAFISLKPSRWLAVKLRRYCGEPDTEGSEKEDCQGQEFKSPPRWCDCRGNDARNEPDTQPNQSNRAYVRTEIGQPILVIHEANFPTMFNEMGVDRAHCFVRAHTPTRSKLEPCQPLNGPTYRK